MIHTALDALARENQFRILFACESGSRAWGFASPDSDYDVRFVYVPSLAWYLQVKSAKDTCECMLPHDLDLSGWELRKLLHHFGSSNITLYEWFGSPIHYLESDLSRTLTELIPHFFNARKAMFHYVSMATGIAQEHLGNEIGIKKLFYIIRALYACHWINEYHSMPPTLFNVLFEKCTIPSDIQDLVQDYLTQKQDAVEGQTIPLNPSLKHWITQQITYFESLANTMPTPENQPFDALDRILYETAIKGMS